jgi:hypothetical protein
MCFKLLYISLTDHLTGLFLLQIVHYIVEITCRMKYKGIDKLSMVEK